MKNIVNELLNNKMKLGVLVLIVVTGWMINYGAWVDLQSDSVISSLAYGVGSSNSAVNNLKDGSMSISDYVKLMKAMNVTEEAQGMQIYMLVTFVLTVASVFLVFKERKKAQISMIALIVMSVCHVLVGTGYVDTVNNQLRNAVELSGTAYMAVVAAIASFVLWKKYRKSLEMNG
ncbi:MAG: hypothetical protein R3Y54_07085 [Eubacteriales bacterium]